MGMLLNIIKEGRIPSRHRSTCRTGIQKIVIMTMLRDGALNLKHRKYESQYKFEKKTVLRKQLRSEADCHGLAIS
jgi:hypothetical protein